MADLKFKPVRHDHKKFLEKASKRRGFSEAYEALEVEYSLTHEMLAARTRAGLTQEAVADRMDTIKSATSNAAQHLGWSDKVGTIEVGKYADIIAVPGNPISNIRLLENVSVVIKDGIVVRAPELSRR